MGDVANMSEEIEDILKFGRELGYPLILDDSAKFFIDLIKAENPHKILEIGTAIGYSGSLILTNCNGQLTTLEKNPQSADIARQNFAKQGLSDRVTVLTCDAGEYLPTLSGEFDFIFLDGPKAQYLHYKNDLIRLLRVGGVLVADNVLFRGLVCKAGEPERRYRTIVKNLRQFLKEIENDDNLQTHIHNIGDGVSVTRKLK